MILPAPEPLDPPPGDPAALAELLTAVTGAAFRTGVLAAHLAGPAARAPGWLGADAAAAADQVATVTGLVRDLHGTLTAAADRLGLHADVLADARRRIDALRHAQEEDFTALLARLAREGAGPEAASAAVEDLRAAETARRREHAALLAEVDTDARQTEGVLAGATTGLGGTGSPGAQARVRAHLAGLLPGWGDAELVSLARSAAAVLDGPVTADGIDAMAREGLPYAGNAAYAGALLAALGVDGVRYLLTVLGSGAAPSEALARFLATTFGAARATESGAGPLADVLGAGYVDPTTRTASPTRSRSGSAPC